MRAAGRLVADILDRVAPLVVPGVTTLELDTAVHDMVRAAGATSATVGYKGYRHASCISINHVVCHGIPSDAAAAGRRHPQHRRDGDPRRLVRRLRAGCTWPARRARKAERLIDITHDALMEGIEQVAPGNSFGDIGAAIQRFAEANRCSVVRDFCGHGLGRVFHAAPNVLHYGRWGTGPVLEPGMFFTIEPMINLGRPETKVLDDDWTAVTKDRSLSAQFEHSVGVTETGLRDLHAVAGRALPPDLGARRLTAGGQPRRGAAGSARPRRRAVHGAARLDGHRHLAAGDRRRHRHRADLAEARAHRLSRGARDLHPGQRLDGRPVRRAQRVPAGDRRLRRRLDRLRLRRFARRPSSLRAVPAGHGRLDDDPGRPAACWCARRRATSSSRRWPG